MTGWYARPVLFVSDIERSLAFYTGQIGFTEDWRYDEGDQRLIVQVSRAGCELILTSQWPGKVGGGLIFISLDPPVLDAVRSELEQKGVEIAEGHWGYRLMVLTDPDGNELYFNYPAQEAA